MGRRLLCAVLGAGLLLSNGAVASGDILDDRFAEVARESREWWAERATPASGSERVASRTAYSDLSASESQELLETSWPAWLGRPLQNPLELGDGGEVVDFLNPYSAAVQTPAGRFMVSSRTPIRAEGDVPVDLSLDKTGTSFESAATTTDVSLAEASTGGVRLEDAQVTAGPEEVASKPQTVVNGRLFAAEVVPDIDQIVEPTAVGARYLWQVRSAAAAESIALDLDIPAGASLRLAPAVELAPGRIGPRSAEVVRDGEVISRITAPVTVDADGLEVPSELVVEGDDVRVRFAHHGGDWRYPLLVDPEVQDTWTTSSGGGQFGDPAWFDFLDVKGGPTLFGLYRDYVDPASGLGLLSRAFQGGAYFDQASGQWRYSALPNTFISQASFAVIHAPGSQFGAMYVTGLTPKDGSGTEASRAIYRPSTLVYGHSFSTTLNIAWNDDPATPAVETPPDNNSFTMAQLIQNGGTGSLPADANLRMTQASLWFGDRHRASVTSGTTGSWTNASSLATSLTASDLGLGITRFGVGRTDQLGPGQPGYNASTYWLGTADQNCTGTRTARCPLNPPTTSVTTSLTALPQGVNTVRSTVVEAVGDATNGATTWQIKKDTSPPTIDTPTGSFYVDRASGFRRSRTLTVNISGEGSTSSPDLRRSGLRSVRVVADIPGTADLELARSDYAQQDSNAPDPSFAIRGAMLAAGDHTIRIEAQDWAGNTSTREFTIAVLDGGPGTTYTEKLDDRTGLEVDLASGELKLGARDVSINSIGGLDLALGRTYTSTSLQNGRLDSAGWRWTSGPDVAMQRQDLPANAENDRVFKAPDGRQFRFAESNGTFLQPSQVNAKLTTASDGRLELKFDRSEETWRFSSSDAGRLEQIEDKNGNKIDVEYDVNGRLNKLKNRLGRTLTVSYVSNTKWEVTDWTARKWTYNRDATTGRLTSYVDPDNDTTQYTYDTAGRLRTLVDGRGHTTQFSYRAEDGRITEIRHLGAGADPDGTGPQPPGDVTTTFSYEEPTTTTCGSNFASNGVVSQTVVTNPRNNATRYCTKVNEQTVRVRDADGGTREPSYTPNGDLNQLVGTPSGSTDPATASFTYTSSNSLDDGTGGAGEQFDVSYDSSKPRGTFRPRSTLDENGLAQQFDYDANGNISVIGTGNGSSGNKATLDWTDFGTLDSATDAENRTTDYVDSNDPDGSGPLTGDGNIERIKYDGAAIADTVLTYDVLNRVETSTDGRGIKTTYTYDGSDRVKTVSANFGLSTAYAWLYVYDANGNLLTRTDQKLNKTTTNVYDRLNRLSNETAPSGNQVIYGYDGAGNLTSLTEAGLVTAYTYDNIDRLTQITPPGSGAINVAPNSAQRTVTYTFPGGLAEKTARDKSGKVTKIEVLQGSTVVRSRTYSYKETTSSPERSQVQRLTEQDGTTTDYDYDANSQLTAVTVDGQGTANDRSWQYTYDKASNRLTMRKEDSSGVTNTTYTYNGVNQLCWRVDRSVTGATCSTPPSDAIDYDYDDEGNLLDSTTGTEFGYDDFSRMTATKEGAASTVNRSYDSPTNALLAGIGNSTLKRNAYGLSANSPAGRLLFRAPDGRVVAQRSGTSTWHYLTVDRLGSTVGLISGTSLAQEYRYDPDGNGTTTASGGPITDIKYAGGHDTGTGLYHFGQRYYSPGIARWTQADRLQQATDLRQANRYQYAGNDPVNNTDPTGQLFDDILEGTFLEDTFVDQAFNCLNPVGRTSLEGAAFGAAGGFALGAASAEDLGPVGKAGVGLVSGAVGLGIGHNVGGLLGCAGLAG